MDSQRYNFEGAITNMFIEYTESAITEVELNELTNEVRNSIRNIIIRRATEADLSAQLAVEQARELVQRAINQNHINQNHINQNHINQNHLVPINILSPSIAMRSMPQFVDILTEETEETELISKIEMVEEEVLNKEGCSICMDYHKKDDSITTDCGHIFGLNCYKDWFNAPNGNKSCPYCRKYCPIITIYKMQSDK